jgi:hypothetical protein
MPARLRQALHRARRKQIEQVIAVNLTGPIS